MVAAYGKLTALAVRLLQNPTAQSSFLLAVAAVGLVMNASLAELNQTASGLDKRVGALDARVAAQTEIVAKLQVDLQVLRATGQVESARTGERIGAIEQRVREMETRQRERDAVFDAAFEKHRQAMREWEAEDPKRARARP